MATWLLAATELPAWALVVLILALVTYKTIYIILVFLIIHEGMEKNCKEIIFGKLKIFWERARGKKGTADSASPRQRKQQQADEQDTDFPDKQPK